MFKNLGLQARIIGAFLLMAILVMIVSLVGLSGNQNLSEHIRTLGKNNAPSLYHLGIINEAQTAIKASQRNLLIPQVAKEERLKSRQTIESKFKVITDSFKVYESLSIDDTELGIYRELKSPWEEWTQNSRRFSELSDEFDSADIPNPLQVMFDLTQKGQANSPEFVKAKNAADVLAKLVSFSLVTLNPSFYKADDAINKLLSYNLNLSVKTALKAEEDATKAIRNSLGIAIAGAAIAIFFGVVFSNMIAKPLGAKIAGVVSVAEKISIGDLTSRVPESSTKDEIGKLLDAFRLMTHNLNGLIGKVSQTGIKIMTSSTQISASGKQLEATVNEQVASTNEVVATAKEIAATSTELVHVMNEVSRSAEATADSASGGQQELTRMENTMRQLAEATGSISSKLGIISEKANNINSIVTTITKVADQTNLLSLNAAIEAEKAGEYGLGFAVVAREIRRLADQTAVATLDIETMVKEMQSAVATGVMEMDKFTREVGHGVDDIRGISGKLAGIIHQVQGLTPRFDAVSQGMEGQSLGATQISEAMVQLSEAANQTADALREINRAIDQLNEAGYDLRQEISRFQLLS
ncbi:MULTISPECIES: methyl-accepting chemotaxis protein [Pseudanabaena]|uniref:Methyl-accepting chemotaxis sensory transducer n=2 Tax=Pseudanabaena TaxID=1152 RepID=L8N1W0_9CYAN|nr:MULTISPECIES: methyl-accepting chemotaxis protein [Pseudanabaena]ELS32720.1 methyl-accepting chemotaxis sensory transducer [Pseudanabaena biceps PCC 7429]MDG3495041.1 methyl-accepting chemotaxis protein [Pseudanabaena catenata USMAC16]